MSAVLLAVKCLSFDSSYAPFQLKWTPSLTEIQTIFFPLRSLYSHCVNYGWWKYLIKKKKTGKHSSFLSGTDTRPIKKIQCLHDLGLPQQPQHFQAEITLGIFWRFGETYRSEKLALLVSTRYLYTDKIIAQNLKNISNSYQKIICNMLPCAFFF